MLMLLWTQINIQSPTHARHQSFCQLNKKTKVKSSKASQNFKFLNTDHEFTFGWCYRDVLKTNYCIHTCWMWSILYMWGTTEIIYSIILWGSITVLDCKPKDCLLCILHCHKLFLLHVKNTHSYSRTSKSHSHTTSELKSRICSSKLSPDVEKPPKSQPRG